MEQPNKHSQKNTYLVLSVAGLFILFDHFIGVWKLIALLLAIYGIYLIRSDNEKKGYFLVIAAAFFLAGGPFAIIVCVVLISLGLFYRSSKQLHHNVDYSQRESFIGSIRYDTEPWVLRDMSLWHAVGEMRFDFSLAIPEAKEVTVILQGMVGSLHIIIPEDMAVSIEGTVYAGVLNVIGSKREGLSNKVVWQSPQYDQAEMKVKLIASYLVGEVSIKTI
ncbi:MAG: cell wall-active antibiotics response protein [Gorillibacterium sp.]|nr:cell wall-active antibiotics response protein [Gorillibacterium sp.]